MSREQTRVMTRVTWRVPGLWYAGIELFQGKRLGEAGSPPPDPSKLVDSFEYGPFVRELDCLDFVTGELRAVLIRLRDQCERNGGTIDSVAFADLKATLGTKPKPGPAGN